jgi:hypothetical protein
MNVYEWLAAFSRNYLNNTLSHRKCRSTRVSITDSVERADIEKEGPQTWWKLRFSYLYS